MWVGVGYTLAAVSAIQVDKVTTAVIHSGDEEEVFICADSETAWKKVANWMLAGLGTMRADWGPEESDLVSFKEAIERKDYAEAAELWDEMTNGEQHFEVDRAEVLMAEKEPVWPAGIEI